MEPQLGQQESELQDVQYRAYLRGIGGECIARGQRHLDTAANNPAERRVGQYDPPLHAGEPIAYENWHLDRRVPGKYKVQAEIASRSPQTFISNAILSNAGERLIFGYLFILTIDTNHRLSGDHFKTFLTEGQFALIPISHGVSFQVPFHINDSLLKEN